MEKNVISSGRAQRRYAAISAPGNRWSTSLFAALIFVAILWPRYFFVSAGPIGLNPYTLVSTLLILCPMVVFLWSPRYRDAWIIEFFKSAPITMSFVLMIVMQYISNAGGSSVEASNRQTTNFLLFDGSWLFIGAVFGVNSRNRRSLSILICLSMIVCWGVGIAELGLGETVLNFTGLRGLAVGDANLLSSAIDIKYRDGTPRIQSLFDHPIIYGQFSAAFAPIAIHLLRSGRFYSKIAAVAGILAMMFAVYFSGSRSNYTVLLCSTAVYLICSLMVIKNVTRRIVTLLFLVIGIAMVAPVVSAVINPLLEGRSSAETASTNMRRVMLAKGQDAIANQPFLGYGAGSSIYIAGIKSDRVGSILSIDNFYLTTAIDFGYIGLIAWLLVLLGIMWVGLRLSWKLRGDQESDRINALLGWSIGMASGLLVVSLIETISYILLVAGYLVGVRCELAVQPGLRGDLVS